MPGGKLQILHQLVDENTISPTAAKQIKKLFRETINQVLEEENCTVCPIPIEARGDIGHLAGMIRDLGDGDMSKGIEVIREDHRFVKRWESLEQKVGGWVLKAFITFILALLFGATIFGLFGKKLPI